MIRFKAILLSAALVATLSASAAQGMPIPQPVPGPTHPAPSPTATVPEDTFIAVGDSITCGVGCGALDSYRAELTRLAAKGGHPITWVVAAVGGTKCSYWADQIETLLTTHNPDVMVLNCGTNDLPGDPTEASYRTILDAAQAHGVTVVATLIGLPDMRNPVNSVRPEIKGIMEGTNDILADVFADYLDVAVADLQQIPANLEFKFDGIHCSLPDNVNERCDDAMGQLYYQALQPKMGWPTLAQMGEREMCGLNGSRDTAPEPVPNVDYWTCLR